jgi:DUF1680 family protein
MNLLRTIFRDRLFTSIILAAASVSAPSARAQNPVAPVVQLVTQPFALTNVQLLSGPFRDAQLRDKAYLLSLDADRFLYNFRANYGLSNSVASYGGWDVPSSEQRGAIVGHHLSACAQMYASTGDPLLKARVDYIVSNFAQCQALATNAGYHAGYLSGFPESFIDRVVNLQPVWAPWYALHKIMAGLLDSYQLCQNTQALDVLVKQASWVQYRIDMLTSNQVQAMLDTEFGGMNEVLANLYAITGNTNHLRIAEAFDHARMFNPLAAGIDPLDGYHANTQIPKMIGAAREYEMTGITRYHDIASFFWQRVAQYRSFAMGGHGDYEYFFPITDFPLHLTPNTCETCNTYNMLKLTRHLFEWQPDAVTMDFYERALFNHILASQEPNQGMMTYLVSLKPGHFKTYCTPDNSFWCCTGTGMENHSKYGDTIFFHGTNSLYWNLFIASQVTWPEKGLVVRQDTGFPQTNTTRLTFQCTNGLALDLKIRQPAWAQAGLGIAINGVAQNVSNAPASYLTLSRSWQTGDVVDIALPMSLRTEPLPDDTNTVALLYGPIVLAGTLGTAWMPASDLAAGQTDYVNIPTPLAPLFVANTTTLLQNTVPVTNQPLTFATHSLGQPRDVTLIPFYQLHHQRYSVYWKLYTTAGWAQYAAQVASDEARGTDSVAIGDTASESAHGLVTTNSNNGTAFGLNWRDASNGGSFSYKLAVSTNQAMQIVVKYWGSDTGGRVFDIVVEGQIIATQTLTNNLPGQFFDVTYPIPTNLTAGKSQVTVAFQAHPGMMAGGIFGLRTQTVQDPGALQSIAMTVRPNASPDMRQTAWVTANYQTITNRSIQGSPWLTFDSSDTNIFTVTTNGVIQAVKSGTATVTARYLGFSATQTVTVTARPSPALRHRYSFTAAKVVNGTNVIDSMNPANPAFRATLRGAATISNGQLVLNGSAGTYVDLPSGIISNYDGVTVEAWASFGATPTWSYLFAFGDTLISGVGAAGFYFTPHSAYGDHRLILSDVPGHEFLETQTGYLDNLSSQQIVAVIDPDYGYEALYINGALVGERNDVPFGMNTITNNHSYIGKSAFTWDPPLLGSVSEVRIYRGRWQASDVAASFHAGPARITAQLQGTTNADGRSLTLTWTPPDPAIILQSSPTLLPTPTWSDFAITPIVTNDQASISFPITNAARFFRLKP